MLFVLRRLGFAAVAVLAACVDRPTPRFPHRRHLVELACNAPGKPACREPSWASASPR